MRIAHLSDLHLLDLEGAVPLRLLNKRLTGYLNLRLHRRSVHRASAAQAVAREIRRRGVDHVVITGDVTNLSLEAEFQLVRTFLDDHLGLPADRVSLVPGNHDVYTEGARRDDRFARFFGPFLHGDVDLGAILGLPQREASFPYVRLRGPVAIVGLSTATPRLPLVASGEIGDAQLQMLARILELPELQGRLPVILQHHPWHNPPSRAKAFLEGLADARREQDVLRRVARGLLLHGHLHRRIHRTLPTHAGYLDAVGATSASLLHDSDERMAGFNLYDVADDLSVSISSARLVLEPGTERASSFRDVPVPRA